MACQIIFYQTKIKKKKFRQILHTGPLTLSVCNACVTDLHSCDQRRQHQQVKVGAGQRLFHLVDELLREAWTPHWINIIGLRSEEAPLLYAHRTAAGKTPRHAGAPRSGTSAGPFPCRSQSRAAGWCCH